jgi:hypothetical protein
MRIQSLGSLFIVLSLGSCSDSAPISRNPDQRPISGNASGKPCLDLTSPTTWQGGISAIFQKNCGTCHPGSRPSDYVSLAGVKRGIQSELAYIDNNSMPPSSAAPLTKADKDAIHAWVTAGFPESTGTGTASTTPAGTPSSTTDCIPAQSPPAVDPVNPVTPVTPVTPSTSSALVSTYSGGVSAIMTASCLGCHSSGQKLPYLDSLAGVKNNYTAVMRDINSGSMPQGSSKLTADKILILTNWGKAPNSPYSQWAP